MNVLTYLVDYGIIGLLAVLSLWALVVAVERWLYYRRVTPNQFDKHSDDGNSPDEAAGRDRNGGGQRTLYRALGNRIGNHVDVPYDGHLGGDGGRCDYGWTKFGAQGDGYWITGGDPMCRAQQYPSSACYRTTHLIQGAAWSVN